MNLKFEIFNLKFLIIIVILIALIPLLALGYKSFFQKSPNNSPISSTPSPSPTQSSRNTPAPEVKYKDISEPQAGSAPGGGSDSTSANDNQ